MARQTPLPEILIREPEGFSVWSGPPFSNAQPMVKITNVACINAKFSENGSMLMVIKSNSIVNIYDSNIFKEIRSFEIPDLSQASLSPLGNYLQTFQKATSQEKNVTLWKVDNGSSVYQHFQKIITKESWPSIRFSSNQTRACCLVSNEIQFFDAEDLSRGIVYRVRIPGVAAIELSREPCSHVAAFVPESKGVPSSVQIYDCLERSQNHPVARRNFFRCSAVQLIWNQESTGLLVVAHSDVDKTNQSYYGESKLYYLTTDGSYEGLVPLRKDGPIHDVQWSYSSKEFAVVYGFMPASATIFNKKCNPMLELGSGPYNTIKWNPKGNFLCLAGFGNLPGHMAFWDCTAKKLLGTAQAEWSVTSEWSSNGQFFMTAMTAPRRQVDNGIKIFHYNGSLYFEKMFSKLYQAEWRPLSPDNFGDVSELIKSISSLKMEEKNRGSSGRPSLSLSTPMQKPAAYRPPHAKEAASIRAELLGGIPSSTEEMSKNALKNKKKREKQKEKKAAAAAAAESG